MLIISLGLAVIGLAALVFAVVTSNEWVAWFCIGASVLGVVLLIVDALQERRNQASSGTAGRELSADEDDHNGGYSTAAAEQADRTSAHPDSGETAGDKNS